MGSFCILGHRKQICTWTRQRLDSMGKPLGHGPIYDWSCEPQSLALKPTLQEGNNVTSNEICYKRCHEHTTCQECLDSSGGGEGGKREKTFVIYFDSVLNENSKNFEP